MFERCRSALARFVGMYMKKELHSNASTGSRYYAGPILTVLYFLRNIKFEI